MSAYLIQTDLWTLSERLSLALGCHLTVGEVRELLCTAGFVESPFGWLTNDPRLLMLLHLHAGPGLF